MQGARNELVVSEEKGTRLRGNEGTTEKKNHGSGLPASAKSAPLHFLHRWISIGFAYDRHFAGSII